MIALVLPGYDFGETEVRLRGKVLLSGYYGFGNVGDEAILRPPCWIRERSPGIEISVLSANPAETACSYGVETTEGCRRGKRIGSAGQRPRCLRWRQPLRRYFVQVAPVLHIHNPRFPSSRPVVVYANGGTDTLLGWTLLTRVALSKVSVSRYATESEKLLLRMGVKRPVGHRRPAFLLSPCGKEADQITGAGISDDSRSYGWR